MGYKQLYQIACDYPGCTVTDTVASEHGLPLSREVASAHGLPLSDDLRNPVPEGWRKFRDTETDAFGTFCPGCSAILEEGKPSLEGLTPLGGCPHCSASVYRTPSGLACENGHGGWVPEELSQLFDNVRPEGSSYAPVPFPEKLSKLELNESYVIGRVKIASSGQTPAEKESALAILDAAYQRAFASADEVDAHVAVARASWDERPEGMSYASKRCSLCDRLHPDHDAYCPTVASADEVAAHKARERKFWGEPELSPVTLPGPDYMPAWDQSDGAPCCAANMAGDEGHSEGCALEVPTEPQPADEEEASLQEAIAEGDLVYALYTDGRIFKKRFQNASCAKVAAQQQYDIPVEPSKLVSWYQWELVPAESIEGTPT